MGFLIFTYWVEPGHVTSESSNRAGRDRNGSENLDEGRHFVSLNSSESNCYKIVECGRGELLRIACE